MIRFKRLAFIPITVIAILLAFGNLITPAQANSTDISAPTPIGTPTSTDPDGQGEPASPEQQEELKAVIQSYFEIRYQSNSVSQPAGFQLDDFGGLVSDEADAKPFKDTELAKLAVEKKHAELNQLRYVGYKYFLDFRSISVDPNARKAIVSVIEDNEVIYEISVKVNPEEPIVSRRLNVEHLIVLKLKKGQWKIVSDEYNDYLWMKLRGGKKKTTDEILQATDELLSTIEAAPGPAVPTNDAETVTTLSLIDDPSTHAYDRDAAVAYAFKYVDSDLDKDEYNPNYARYDQDCQNFVSQAIYEGGNASMSIPSPLPLPSARGQEGWYYLTDMQRGRYWSDVEAFYDYVTQSYQYWHEGPEGYEITIPVGSNRLPPTLMHGDVIQFQWPLPNDGDNYWDHSVIVDTISGGMAYVDSHTTDYVREPFSTFDYKAARFIHIERSDGYPTVKAQLMSVIDDAGSFTQNSVCFPFNTYDPIRNYLGSCANGSGGLTTGFQFRNVQIPKGATIKYAYVIFTVDGPYTVDPSSSDIYAPIKLTIKGENTGTPADFSSDNPPANRADNTLTAAFATWTIDGTTNPYEKQDGTIDPYAYDAWPFKDKRATPDIKDIISEITSNNWAPGGKISLIFKNVPGSTYIRRTIAWDELSNPDGLIPARLVVGYDTTGGTTVQTRTYLSGAAQDGYVLESSEGSNRGGSPNSNATTFYVGDDNSDKQYRSILHFDMGTNGLPANAVITSVVLKIKREIIQGTDPFTTHGNLLVSIKQPSFGNVNLAKSDFEAGADIVWAATVDPVPSEDGWYTAQLYSSAFTYINRTGTTQFRLGFLNDDNDDQSADYLSFWSGDNATDQPKLIITYYTP